MKILIVNAIDISGGAARAAFRLHEALREQGVKSQMLVQKKLSSDRDVKGPLKESSRLSRFLLKNFYSEFRSFIDDFPFSFYPNRSRIKYSASWMPFSPIVKRINQIKPDIVHLHWVNNAMLRIEDLASIKAPIVWSLHDMWAFTGGCHYDEECGNYSDSCKKCPVLKSEKENDLSAKIFKRKASTYNKLKLNIVGLSKWLEGLAKNSSLLKDHQVINLPNPINAKQFNPVEKPIAKKILGLPNNKKLVLFGAMSTTDDKRKGYKELSEALSNLNNPNTELMVFGSEQPNNPPDFGFKTHYLGRINDNISLQILYSAADVMVVPSLQENLSNVIMESLSCATPVVGFNIGGNSDMIDHKQNGYLAQPFDTNDLANGISWILNHSGHKLLCDNARNKVLKCFDYPIVAEQYISFYKKILDNQNLRL